MNRKDEIERLKHEIKYAKEAHLFSGQYGGVNTIREAYKDQIPLRFRHLVNSEPEQLEEHISRLEKDLADLQDGEFHND